MGRGEAGAAEAAVQVGVMASGSEQADVLLRAARRGDPDAFMELLAPERGAPACRLLTFIPGPGRTTRKKDRPVGKGKLPARFLQISQLFRKSGILVQLSQR